MGWGVRLLELVTGQVTPDEGGGSLPDNIDYDRGGVAPCWSKYRDGTVREFRLTEDMPGTVALEQTNAAVLAGWYGMTDEQKEEAQQRIYTALRNEKPLNLKHQKKTAQHMFKLGVNRSEAERRTAEIIAAIKREMAT